MILKVYNNPYLFDFIQVCAEMPEDEQKQLEAFTGQKYDIDRAAVGNYEVAGPKWVVKVDDKPICIAGFVPQRPGVWRDFMLTTPSVWTTHWFAITRIVRRGMNAMLESGEAHRLECITPASRLAYRPEIERWYSAIGYTKEAPLWRYCADGSDAVSFSRIRK